MSQFNDVSKYRLHLEGNNLPTRLKINRGPIKLCIIDQIGLTNQAFIFLKIIKNNIRLRKITHVEEMNYYLIFVMTSELISNILHVNLLHTSFTDFFQLSQ